MNLLYYYLGGLAMAFTPCIWPMIPITASLLMNGKKNIHLVVVYCLTVALSYALLGLIFGSLGIQIQFLVAGGPFTIGVGLFMVLMGIMQLGLIPVPAMIFIKDIPTVGLGKAILMGLASVFVLSPCGTPILAAALTYILDTGDSLSGALMLFILGLGVVTPLVLVSVFGHHILKKYNKYLNYLKYIGGTAIIVLGFYLIYDGVNLL